jgi:anti-sigma factor RsiW
MERDDRRIPGPSGDPMSCDACRSLILDYLEGALHVEAARQVETHVARCPMCQTELALAQTIESALSGQELRLPPADFTARVLVALPAARTAGESFWSHLLVPMVYAVSILALVLGLGRDLLDLSRVAVAWSDWVSMLPRILDLGWLAPSVAPGRPEELFRTAMGVVGDALASVAAMNEQLQGLYSANAPVIHLILAALALLWVLYDDRQEARE